MCTWLLIGVAVTGGSLGAIVVILWLDNTHLREQLRRQSLNEAWHLRQTAGLYQLLDRLTDRGGGWKDRTWD